MSSPIPRSLLPQTVTLEPYTGTANQIATYGPAITLQHVRVDPVLQKAMTSLGDTRNDKLTLIIDRLNTIPSQTVPKEKDKVTFEGATFTVRSIAAIYGRGPFVHHWEVSLV